MQRSRFARRSFLVAATGAAALWSACQPFDFLANDAGNGRDGLEACTVDGSQPLADIAQADCAVVG